MENRSILIAFVIAWALYVPAIYAVNFRMRWGLSLATLSHLVPTVIALSMIGIFLIGDGATVHQLVSGSESGMDLWSLWVGLWPLFLFAAFLSGTIHAVATFAAAIIPGRRRYLVLAIPGILMAVFAFFTVAENFPDA